jgi:hypothetical protein
LSLRAPATLYLDSGWASWSFLVVTISILNFEFYLTRQEVTNEVNEKEGAKMGCSCDFFVVRYLAHTRQENYATSKQGGMWLDPLAAFAVHCSAPAGLIILRARQISRHFGSWPSHASSCLHSCKTILVLFPGALTDQNRLHG